MVGKISEYPCNKINGVKYYQDGNTVFAIMNDKKYIQNDRRDMNKNQNGKKYYEDAYNFKENVTMKNDTLKNLKASTAVDTQGNKYSEMENNPFFDYEIFKEISSSDSYIEDENSKFNAHKLQVIQNSIESNLIPAISNYNKISTSATNFAMPKLKDDEWEKLIQNVSMVTFLQGLNIGGKIYNGYSIVSNTNNEDFVSENSIYILKDQGYHEVREMGLEVDENTVGVLNVDFERRMTTVGREDKKKTIYFYPKSQQASYNSIINRNGNQQKNIYEYFKDASNNTSHKLYKLAQIYYTALGRERYGMYRVTNKLEKIQELYKNNS